MTVNYEGVLYESGPVSNGTVLGFDVVHYDNTPSPLRNLGQLINQGSNIIKDIQNGDLGSAVQNSINAYNIVGGQNTQLKQTPSIDLSSIGNSILQGKNPLSPVYAPTSATVQQGLATGSTPIPGLASNNVNVNTQNNQLPSSNQGIITP